MMYPLMGSPPEFILNNEDSVHHSEALTGSLSSAGGSASQEETGHHNPTEPVSQKSSEISTEETICSFLAHRRQVSVAPSPLMFADLDRGLVGCDQQNQQPRQYLPLSPTDPEQAQNKSWMNLLPAVLPSPLNLSFSPAWVQSGPTLSPASSFSPPNLSNTSLLLISPQPMFVSSPRVPISSPVQLRYGGVFLLSPFAIRPESRPSWCSCSVPSRPIHSPALTSSKTTITVTNANMTPPLESNQRSAKTQGERRQIFTPNKDEAQQNCTEQKVKDFCVSPLKFEACEDCLDVLMSLCSEVNENVDEDEKDESKTKGTLETENSSFQEYLDKLCSDQNFTQNVSSTLDVDYLTSLSLSGLDDPLQQSVTTEDSDLLPVETDPVTVKSPPPSRDETLQYLTSEPPHRKLEAEGRDAAEKSWCFSSPLLASHLLEEPAGTSVDTSPPSHEENKSRVAACRTVCLCCCFFLDAVSLSCPIPPKDDVSVSLPKKQTTSPGPQDGPCDGVPSVLKTGEEHDMQGQRDTQDKHTEQMKKLQTEEKSGETVEMEQRDTESETRPKLCVPGPSGQKNIDMDGKPEDKNQKSRGTGESTPRRDPAGLRKHRHLFGRRRLFKESDENKTSTELEPSKTPKDLKEDEQESKIPGEKPLGSCTETMEARTRSSERQARKEERKNANAGTPRPKNTVDRRRVTKVKTKQTSTRRKPETSSDSEDQLQSPSYSSPVKRHSETKDKCGGKKKVIEKASTVPKVKTSRTRFVLCQMDRETMHEDAQEASRTSLLEDKPEPRRPTKGPKSTAVKTREQRPKPAKMSQQNLENPGNLESKAPQRKGNKREVKLKPELEEEEGDEEEQQNDLWAPLKKHKKQRGAAKQKKRNVNDIIQLMEYKLMGGKKVKLSLAETHRKDKRTEETPRRKAASAKKKPSTV